MCDVYVSLSSFRKSQNPIWNKNRKVRWHQSHLKLTKQTPHQKISDVIKPLT